MKNSISRCYSCKVTNGEIHKLGCKRLGGNELVMTINKFPQSMTDADRRKVSSAELLEAAKYAVEWLAPGINETGIKTISSKLKAAIAKTRGGNQMKTKTGHTPGPCEILESAIEWMCDAEKHTDQWERGQELKKLRRYIPRQEKHLSNGIALCVDDHTGNGKCGIKVYDVLVSIGLNSDEANIISDEINYAYRNRAQKALEDKSWE